MDPKYIGLIIVGVMGAGVLAAIGTTTYRDRNRHRDTEFMHRLRPEYYPESYGRQNPNNGYADSYDTYNTDQYRFVNRPGSGTPRNSVNSDYIFGGKRKKSRKSKKI